MTKTLRITAFLALIAQAISAQVSIEGQVMDAVTRRPIPYASLGVKGAPFGTVCDDEGKFTLTLKTVKETDSLKIGAIGYSSRTFEIKKASAFKGEVIYLKPVDVLLNEVVVKPGKTVQKVLGNKRYNKNVFCSFTGIEGNYKGAEAAIKANNKKNRLVWFEHFNFYILKNAFTDSITFRLNFYKENPDGMPGENILNKPIIFKTATKEGEVKVNLKSYAISAQGDFFISLECLDDNMSREMLNFSGSLSGPSFFKFASFGKWERSPLMGLDFNVTVSYLK